MAYNLLLVDDDVSFRQEFCGCFEEYMITQAPDGETAIDILKKPNSIDLVLLDFAMPGLKGTEVLVEIKKIKPEIKVVMITGNRSRDVTLEALKNKADEFIEKPMNVDETRGIIVKMLGDTEAQGVPDTGSIEAKIEKVRTFIERNFDKKISLQDAAEHVGLNAKYLSRVFEENGGMGFSDFKAAVRVKNAKELLLQGFNVNQISDKLAYANAESFIRTFKKVTGTTPAAYRDKKKAGRVKAAKKSRLKMKVKAGAKRKKK